MVQIRITGAEKQSCTIMLSHITQLPPYVIFKWKMMIKAKFPQGVIVRAQD
jgi:hypothetical protein